MNEEIDPNKNLSLESMEGEVWKDIENYDGFYQISNLGRVKYTGKKKVDSIGRLTYKKPRIRILNKNVAGYWYVVLRVSNKNSTKTVHRLVCEAFIPNLENKCCVNHIDCNKLNNKIENLEWCTIRENSKHWIENDSNQSSNFAGLRKDTKYGYYKTYIFIGSKEYYLGIFEDEKEGYKAYEKALKEWMDHGKKPKHNNRGRFSSKYKGIYKRDDGMWIAQFQNTEGFFYVGSFCQEIEAKNALDKVKKEYEDTGVFPTKKYASKYIGLSYKKNLNKWQATCKDPGTGKRKYLGVFKEQLDAAEAVKEFLGLEKLLER